MKLVTEKTDSKNIQFKSKGINIDLRNAVFELDVLQQSLIQKYLREDRNFLRAYYTDYTPLFFQFIQEKAQLNEPVHFSIMGGVRGGKTECYGSKILMQNGEWKNIEDVQVGDYVLSPQLDNSVICAKVIRNEHWFCDNNYSIVDKNTNEELYNCIDQHPIPFYARYDINRKRLPNGKRANGDSEFRIKHWTAEEYLALSSSFKRKHYPMTFRSPVIESFGQHNPKIDGYALGVFLGNGCFTTALSISQQNLEPIHKISIKYPYSRFREKNNCFDFFYLQNSNLYKQLLDLGLRNHKAGTKFIPKEALLSDKNYREELLAGLLDTDGHLKENRGSQYDYITKSEQLAKDIQKLCWSLGFKATISKETKGIKSTGFEGEYYRIYIVLSREIPMVVPYKKPKFFEENEVDVRKVAIEIKKSNPSMVCSMEIESKSNWYITNQFLVTHNSSSGVTIGGMMAEARGKLYSVEKIMASEYEFLQTLKENKHVEFGDCFVMDESKQAVFGVGSTAKKLKIQDVQNIIAVNNISTIWIKPDGWSFEGAMYGLRTFGRGQFDKDGNKLPMRINRFMLYNLQESSAGGSLPLGMVYIPHFADYLQNGKELWKAYSDKKQKWVDEEMHGTADSTMESMFRLAEKLTKNVSFSNLKKSTEMEAFITTAMGSEMTRGEIKQLLTLVKLIRQGYTIDMIRGAVNG